MDRSPRAADRSPCTTSTTVTPCKPSDEARTDMGGSEGRRVPPGCAARPAAEARRVEAGTARQAGGEQCSSSRGSPVISRRVPAPSVAPGSWQWGSHFAHSHRGAASRPAPTAMTRSSEEWREASAAARARAVPRTRPDHRRPSRGRRRAARPPSADRPACRARRGSAASRRRSAVPARRPARSAVGRAEWPVPAGRVRRAPARSPRPPPGVPIRGCLRRRGPTAARETGEGSTARPAAPSRCATVRRVRDR